MYVYNCAWDSKSAWFVGRSWYGMPPFCGCFAMTTTRTKWWEQTRLASNMSSWSRFSAKHNQHKSKIKIYLGISWVFPTIVYHQIGVLPSSSIIWYHSLLNCRKLGYTSIFRCHTQIRYNGSLLYPTKYPQEYAMSVVKLPATTQVAGQPHSAPSPGRLRASTFVAPCGDHWYRDSRRNYTGFHQNIAVISAKKNPSVGYHVFHVFSQQNLLWSRRFHLVATSKIFITEHKHNDVHP